MRILFVINKPQRRGAEVFARDLARELERHGHATSLLALYPHQGGAPLPLRPQDGVVGGNEGHPFERFPGVHPGVLRALDRAVGAFRPDVVQVNGSRTVKYGSVLRRLRRRDAWALLYRNIGSPNTWLKGSLRRLAYGRLVGGAVDGVVGVSRTTLTEAIEVYRLRVPHDAIPRGVDHGALIPRVPRAELRARLGVPPDRPVLLFVGSLTPEKRLDRLLRVASAVAAGGADVDLWLVGEGPERDRLTEQSRSLANRLSVRLLGACDDVATYMAAADLLLLTSDTEGVPGVVLEAGCLGLPAVATRVGGVAECVQDGVTGLLADPEDEDALSAAVAKLIRDPEERRRLGDAAQRRTLERFTIGPIADRYLALYARVLNARRRCEG